MNAGHRWTQNGAPLVGRLSQRCERCGIVRWWDAALFQMEAARYAIRGRAPTDSDPRLLAVPRCWPDAPRLRMVPRTHRPGGSERMKRRERPARRVDLPRLPARLRRSIAVEADICPETLGRYLDAKPIRARYHLRIATVLRGRGLSDYIRTDQGVA